MQFRLFLWLVTCLVPLPLMAVEADQSAESLSAADVAALDAMPDAADVNPATVLLPNGLTMADFDAYQQWLQVQGLAGTDQTLCDFTDELLQHYRIGDTARANTSIVSHAAARHDVHGIGGLTEKERQGYMMHASAVTGGTRWPDTTLLPNGLTVAEFKMFETDEWGPNVQKKYNHDICPLKNFLMQHYRQLAATKAP